MDTKVLVGTTKGAFILTSADRSNWTVDGPFCDGMPVNHVSGTSEWGTGSQRY